MSLLMLRVSDPQYPRDNKLWIHHPIQENNTYGSLDQASHKDPS